MRSQATTIAESSVLNDSIAELSGAAFALLRDVHAGRGVAPRAEAAQLIGRLREIARCTGVDLYDVPAYRQSTTNWRAIARLAGSGVTSAETTQAG
jgi:hypothetical protein